MTNSEMQGFTPSEPATEANSEQPDRTLADVSRGQFNCLGLFVPDESENWKSFPNGGIVSGPGTGTSDEVRARIPLGAYVVNADAVEIFGVDALELINSISSISEVDADLSNGEFVILPHAVAGFGKGFFDALCVVGLNQRAGTLTDDERQFHEQLLFRAIRKALSNDFVATPPNGMQSAVTTASEEGILPCV